MDDRCENCGSDLTDAEVKSITKRSDGSSLCDACNDPAATGDLPETYVIEPSDKRIGNIAQFTPVRLLGSGAFGDVWLAHDTTLGRSVALKLASLRHPDASTFMYEAKTTAALRHPNIVAIYEVGEHDGQIYIASELIEGITLRDFLTSGKPPIETVVKLLIPIARALHFAHQRGIVHRDVKPANILINEASQPFVTDFGIAKHLRADETISSEGQIVGTARYMSPEQASGKTQETDARSDIYAFGVMMFEMLTGESPFRGNAQAIVSQKISNDAPSPRTLEPGIPKDLETICLKCLERDPAKRFAAASDFADELQRFADGEPIHSRPITRLERGWRWCMKRPAITGLLLALFASLTMGLIGVTYFLTESQRNAATAHRSLFRSLMNLAAFHLANGDTTAVRTVLQRIDDDPDLSPLRGFGWSYHQRLLKPLHRVGSVDGPVVGLATTSDGNVCAATSGGQEVRVWDTSSGELLRSIKANQDGFTALDFSSQTASLVVGSVDGLLRLYEPLASDRMVGQVEHGPPVAFVLYSPDGRYLVSAGRRGAVRLRSPDGKLLAEIPTGKPLATRAIRFSPDGRRLYVAREDGLVRQWSIADVLESAGETVPMPEAEFSTGPQLLAMAISQDGQSLAVACYSGNLVIKSLRDEDVSVPLQVHRTHWGLLQEIEFLADSNKFALTVSEGRMYFVDAGNGRETTFLHTHIVPSGKLAVSHDRKAMLVGSGDGTVSRIAVADLQQPSALWAESPVRSVSFTGTGRSVLAAYDNGELMRWDLDDGTMTPVKPSDEEEISMIAVSSGASLCATAGGRAGIEIRDADTMDVLAALPGKAAGVSAMRFSDSGKLFAFALRQGAVRIYRTEDWSKPQFEVPPQDETAQSIAISPNDRYVAIARNGPLEILDTQQHQTIESIPMGDDAATVVQFCQQGTILAVGTNSGIIQLVEVPSRVVKATIKAHRSRVSAFAELPSNGMLVSGGRDRQLNLWDLESGELVTRLDAHFRQVFTIAVSQDESVIVSGGLEGDIRIWRSGD